MVYETEPTWVERTVGETVAQKVHLSVHHLAVKKEMMMAYLTVG